MERTTALLIGLGVAAVLFALSRTKQGAEVVSDVATSVGNLLSNRGLRDNNPGNIRRGASKWQGSLSQADVLQSGGTWDAEFEQFATIGYGVRALGHTLLTYSSKYGLNTVALIVGRYAPPSENDTDSYVAQVADALNVDGDDEIDVPSRLPELAAAIMKRETGYTDDLDNIRLQVFS